MPRMRIVEASGKPHELQTEEGESVMQVALRNSISGIVGECGGNLACATCHVYVDAPWAERLQPPSSIERDMLEGALYTESGSRLGCQISVTEELDGLVVRLPISQT